MCLYCTVLGLRLFTIIKLLISIRPTNLLYVRLHLSFESEDLFSICYAQLRNEPFLIFSISLQIPRSLRKHRGPYFPKNLRCGSCFVV